MSSVANKGTEDRGINQTVKKERNNKPRAKKPQINRTEWFSDISLKTFIRNTYLLTYSMEQSPS
jgi:hypothetical protein